MDSVDRGLETSSCLGLILENSALPRTVYYQSFVDAVGRHPWYRGAGAGATLVIPAEDTAQEINWPRYGHPATAYCRGVMPKRSADDPVTRYWVDILGYAMAHPETRVLVVNMDPFRRLPLAFRPFANLILADGALAAHERAANRRTISMPAPPFVPTAPRRGVPRPRLASFQGNPSHPVRAALAALHNGDDVVVRLVDRENHVGRIDAERGVSDAAYVELLDQSVFAFVPRGDSIFSYRLLEVMARGAIPVVLSDGWVLPFDRSVDWAACSVSVPEAAAPGVAGMLRRYAPAEIAELQSNLGHIYDSAFGTLDSIVAVLVAEAARLEL